MNTTPTRTETSLVLSPPEVLAAVPRASVNDLVNLKPGDTEVLEGKVERFVEGLMGADLGSTEFKTKLDAAAALGRQSIASSSAVSQRFMDKNFVGMENSPAFNAINGLRSVFEDLNPARAGDLMRPNKIFGIIPFGNKLQAYFRKFDSAGNQIATLMGELRSAEDEVRRDVAAMGEMEAKLWEAMGKVKEAAIFADKLDQRLAAEVTRLKASDPLKAEAVEQEVLFYVRQAHSDLLAQQAPEGVYCFFVCPSVRPSVIATKMSARFPTPEICVCVCPATEGSTEYILRFCFCVLWCATEGSTEFILGGI